MDLTIGSNLTSKHRESSEEPGKSFQQGSSVHRCCIGGLTAVLKELNINAVIYCQRRGILNIKSQLISSGVLAVSITKFLITKKKSKAEPELLDGHQKLHQHSVL